MQSFLDKISDLKCGWNERPLDENAFNRLAKKLKIHVRYMPLTVNGFYTCRKGRHYIVINQKLSPRLAEFVMFHELGHYLMHSPSNDAIDNYCGSATHSRDEKEADAFAYCALLPLGLFAMRSVEELADIYGSGFVMRRLEVYERYGI
ncbi:MAG: ImmA/IrrE family metallo-endopeptidase [Acidobacteriota bacterium]|nr:MAG: ImmA/IrrE family metallo-endopeptidase [Acidobacteriota bacterium]